MLSWILSTILYLATIAAGLFLDFGVVAKTDVRSRAKHIKWKRAYLVWLYVFLCFGYMTGADWRNYEPVYLYGDYILHFLTEPASWFVFSYFPKVIPDFFLFMGIVKCLYLFSVYKLVSTVTDKWASVLALLIPLKLGFMLIQNPLRFMMALIFINFALVYQYKYLSETGSRSRKMVLLIMVFTIISILFHTSCVVYLLLIPLGFLAPKLKKVNPWVLYGIYLFFVFLTSDLTLINSLKRGAIETVQQYMEMSDYANYELEEATGGIRNPIQILFVLIVLISRDKVCAAFKNGPIVYGYTLYYFFMSRLTVLIPTGFRLSLPFNIFFVIFIIYMLEARLRLSRLSLEYKRAGIVQPQPVRPAPSRKRSRYRYMHFPVRVCAQLMIVYTLLSFSKKMWTSIYFIPYSNSIPYLVVGHKPFEYRSQYNMDAYHARTGKYFEGRDDR